MVSLGALWLPILVAAVLVFVASWLVHSVLPHHKSDAGRLPDEDGFLASARAAGTKPGWYVFPYMSGTGAMKDPDFQEKCKQGPVGLLTVGPSGAPNMGKLLFLHFKYCLVVSLLTAYVAGIAHGPGVEYMEVFRITGTTAWIAYSTAHFSASIWFYQPWSVTWKYLLDGLFYALLTAGTFGWLWPAM